MLLVENQSLLPTTYGTIQMVPGRTGYEPSNRDDGAGGMDVYYASRESRYRTPELLDETNETTYNRNRQLTSSRASEIGAYIDVYA